MSHLAPIYAVWNDNAEALAADIGEPGVKVRQWRNRGNIPTRYWSRIIAEAKKRGEDLDMGQFLPPVATVATCGVCDRRADRPECEACTRSDCGLRQKEAA